MLSLYTEKELNSVIADSDDSVRSIRDGIQYHYEQLPAAQERVANAVLELDAALNELISIKHNITLGQQMLAKQHRIIDAAKTLITELSRDFV